MPDCRVFVGGRYIDPSELEGSSPHEDWQAHRRVNQRRQTLQHLCGQATPGMHGSTDLRDRSPRITKHRGGSVEGVRIK